MEEFVRDWTLRVALLADAVATVVIALATLEAAVRSVIAFSRFKAEHQGVQAIRWRFGRWLSLALDFLIASDILRTGVSPSWSEIGQLGAIVVIRIAITAALGREIQEIAPAPKGESPAQ